LIKFFLRGFFDSQPHDAAFFFAWLKHKDAGPRDPLIVEVKSIVGICYGFDSVKDAVGELILSSQ
jgi:hypothetical protein